MEPLSMITAWAAEWATLKVADALLTGAKDNWQSSELDKALKTAIDSAQKAEPKLFSRCKPDGFHGFPRFLGQLFKGLGLRELLKPLNENGIPDVKYLVMAFNKTLSKFPNLDVDSDSIDPWIRIFVTTYVEEISGIAFQVAKEDYLNQLISFFSYFDLAGIDIEHPVDQPIKLEKIYTVPDLKEEPFQRNQHKKSSQQQIYQPENQEQYGCIISAIRLLKDGWIKRALLLGTPGSGKTALMSYFVLRLCGQNPSRGIEDLLVKIFDQEVRHDNIDDRLPIVIRIRELFRHSELSILEFIRDFAKTNLSCKSLPKGFFEYWLEHGRAFIFIDGLDEAPDDQKTNIVERIRSFLGQHAQNRVFITSRPVGNPGQCFPSDEFSCYRIQPFNTWKIHQFIHSWYDSQNSDKAEADRCKANIKRALADNERVNLLAQNPLLLTIILLIHHNQIQLPRKRCDLYDCAVSTLLCSWEATKTSGNFSILKYLESDDLRWLMAKLAYWMHTQSKIGDQESGLLVDKDNLIQQLSIFIQSEKQIRPDQAKEEAKRFRQLIQERAGLLNYQGNDDYAFVHRTFQEYLAAEYICNRSTDLSGLEFLLREVQSNLHRADWHEVILLLVAQLDGEKAARLIRGILYNNSEYEQWLHRDLLFAGLCLAESPKNLAKKEEDARMIADILTRLVKLESRDDLRVGDKVRQQIPDIFLSLSGTSFAKEVLRILNAHSEKISPSRLLMYRLALGSHQESIDKLLTLLKNIKTSSKAIAILEKVSKYSNISEFLIQRLYSEFNGELGIARALSQLGYQDKWIKHVLEDSYYVDIQYEAYTRELEKEQERELRKDYAQVDSLLSELKNGSTSVIDALIEDWLMYGEFGICDYVAKEMGKAKSISQVIELRLLDKLSNTLDKECSTRSWTSWERSQIAEALGYLSHTSSRVLQSLVRLLNDDEDVFVRASAATALSNLDNSYDIVLAQLLNSLRNVHPPDSLDGCCFPGDPYQESRYFTLQVFKALVQLSKVYSQVAPELAHWIGNHHDWDCFEHAVDALWEILDN